MKQDAAWTDLCIECIDDARVDIISGGLNKVLSEIKALSDGTGCYRQCHPDCRHIRIGVLTSSLVKYGLLDVRMETPNYLGVSVTGLKEMLLEVPKSKIHPPCSRDWRCDLSTIIRSCATEIETCESRAQNLVLQALEQGS